MNKNSTHKGIGRHVSGLSNSIKLFLACTAVFITVGNHLIAQNTGIPKNLAVKTVRSITKSQKILLLIF